MTVIARQIPCVNSCYTYAVVHVRSGCPKNCSSMGSILSLGLVWVHGNSLSVDDLIECMRNTSNHDTMPHACDTSA
jgi:hypothetical protein